MGSLNLALKDIWRQKQRSLLFIAVQSFITASGMIMYGLAVTIESQMGQNQAYFNNSILQIFNGHLTFLLSFAVLAGVVVAAILCCLLTIARMDDLAVLLALGGTFKQIQRIPLAQIFLITLISGLLGWIGGIIGLSGFFFLLRFESIDVGYVLNLSFGMIYIIIQIIGTYIAAGFFVNILIRKKFREIIDGQYDVVMVDQKKKNKIWGISFNGGVSFRLAYLFNKRSRILSWFLIGGTFILIFLTTFGILGGDIIHNTTDSYIERGYGAKIHVIAHEKLSPLLQELYDPYGDLQYDTTLFTSSNAIPSSFIEQLPENCSYETRFLSVGEVKMVTEIKTDPSGALLGGGNKTKEAFYWGVDESSFSIFDYYGIKITTPNHSWVKTVKLGDGLVSSFLNKEKIQSIIPLGQEEDTLRFYVDGVIMDPFARGHCVYISSEELTSFISLDTSLKNVIFIVNPDIHVLNLVEKFEDLMIFSLDDFKEKYISLSNSFWIVSTIAFIPAMISAGLSLVAYSGLIARVILIKDLTILRALGGNQKTLMKVIIWVNFLLVLNAAPLAVFFGFVSSYSFLIADPRFPSIQAWLILFGEFLIMVLIIYRYLHSFFKDFYGSF